MARQACPWLRPQPARKDVLDIWRPPRHLEGPSPGPPHVCIFVLAIEAECTCGLVGVPGCVCPMTFTCTCARAEGLSRRLLVNKSAISSFYSGAGRYKLTIMTSLCASWRTGGLSPRVRTEGCGRVLEGTVLKMPTSAPHMCICMGGSPKSKQLPIYPHYQSKRACKERKGDYRF